MLKVFLITLLVCITGSAVDFQKSYEAAEKELIEINQKLNDNRKKVFAEREKLSQEISNTKAELEKNKKSDIQLANEIETLLTEISDIDRQIKINKNSMVDLLQISLSARRELESIIPEISADQYKNSFKEQDNLLNNKDWLNFFQVYEKSQNTLINDGFKIKVLDIEAVNKKGAVENAKLIAIGHSQAFLLMNKQGGFAEVSRHHEYPSLKQIPKAEIGLEKISNGQMGILPFDFTNGLALKKAAREKTIMDRFKSGGAIMYPLAFLALICIIVGLWKTLQLYNIRSEYDDKVSTLVTLIQEGKSSEAQDFINSLKDPVKSLLNDALNHKDISRETLEELLNENILSQIPKLDRFMPVLSVSAGAAPLLGLLGTVMGIIKTFEMIALYGTGDPNTMAGGISEALITTQAGLMVAIPALIWHAMLNRRLKAIVGNLEKAMLSFINALTINKEKS